MFNDDYIKKRIIEIDNIIMQNSEYINILLKEKIILLQQLENKDEIKMDKIPFLQD